MGQSLTSFSTVGGDTVTVFGANLGSSQFDGLSPLVVTYGPSFTATCSRGSGTSMSCSTSPGAGTGYRWRVTSAGLSSADSSFTTGYGARLMDVGCEEVVE